MNKTFIVSNIIQAPNGGSIVLTDPEAKQEPGKPAKPGTSVQIRFATAAEAAAYEQGAEYTMSLTKKKK